MTKIELNRLEELIDKEDVAIAYNKKLSQKDQLELDSLYELSQIASGQIIRH